MKFEIRRPKGVEDGSPSYKYEIYLNGQRLDEGLIDVEIKMPAKSIPKVILTLLPNDLTASIDAIKEINASREEN
jgi:hypothetical protein